VKALTVLGIETSCDETAAAIVRGQAPGPGEILSNVVFSQLELHAPFGGVVPEIAARAHVERLDAIIEAALDEAEVALSEMDAIAATAGPGLIGGVMVGLTTAKALALGASKPLIAINHLEAHALTARLTDGVAFPFLLLLISGGHCQLLGVKGVGEYRPYGTTIDDAVGEAFDKAAKLAGLPYPGGPGIESLAARGNASRYALPRPMRGRASADFSFPVSRRRSVRSCDPRRLSRKIWRLRFRRRSSTASPIVRTPRWRCSGATSQRSPVRALSWLAAWPPTMPFARHCFASPRKKAFRQKYPRPSFAPTMRRWLPGRG